MNGNKVEWIVDTCVANHMISNKELLSAEIEPSVVRSRKVHLPNGKTVDVSHVGHCDIMDGNSIKNVLYILDIKYNVLSVSRLAPKELNCSVKFFPDFCIFQDLLSGKVLDIDEEVEGLYPLHHNGLITRINKCLED